MQDAKSMTRFEATMCRLYSQNYAIYICLVLDNHAWHSFSVTRLVLPPIQVNFEGDPGAALISFSRNNEAASAYHSSEPVFNNRFIKLFWHRPSAKPAADSKANFSSPSVAVEQKKNMEVGVSGSSGLGGSGVYARLGPVSQPTAELSTSEYDPVEVRWATCVCGHLQDIFLSWQCVLLQHWFECLLSL